MDGRPKIKDVAVGVAGETVINLPAQMHREGIGGTADGALAAKLRTAPSCRPIADQAQYAGHGDLPAELAGLAGRLGRGPMFRLSGQGVKEPLQRLHTGTSSGTYAKGFESDATATYLGPTVEGGDVWALALASAGEAFCRLGQGEGLFQKNVNHFVPRVLFLNKSGYTRKYRLTARCSNCFVPFFVPYSTRRDGP